MTRALQWTLRIGGRVAAGMAMVAAYGAKDRTELVAQLAFALAANLTASEAARELDGVR